MDLKQIKLVVDLMKRSELTEFEIEEEGFKLRIKRQGGEGAPASTSTGQTAAPSATARSPEAAQPPGPATQVESVNQAAQSSDEPGTIFVKSPMVGTFYRSPSPESPPFVDSGSRIDEKSVVCIIEAMKIMNEIQAEVKGTVVEVLVENGQPVEYGQRLFKVKIG